MSGPKLDGHHFLSRLQRRAGHAVTTIEGFAADGRLSTVQQAMHEAHALQCGFCTPGIIMTMEAWLAEHPDPTQAEIREALSGNLCRCTGYHNIVTAITNTNPLSR